MVYSFVKMFALCKLGIVEKVEFLMKNYITKNVHQSESHNKQFVPKGLCLKHFKWLTWVFLNDSQYA